MPELQTCPIAAAAAILGDKWTLIILRDLAQGAMRFSEIERRGEGITASVLTGRLRELETRGFLSRTIYPEIPPRVEYLLTPMGRDALGVVDALETFGRKWLIDPPKESAAASAHGAFAPEIGNPAG